MHKDGKIITSTPRIIKANHFLSKKKHQVNMNNFQHFKKEKIPHRAH